MAREPDRAARALVGFAIVASVAPLTPSALDETMLVKLVLVTAVMVVLAGWWFAGAVTYQRVSFVSGWPTRALAVFAGVTAAAVLWSPFPALSFIGTYERYSGGIGYIVYAGLAVAVMRWFAGRAEQVAAYLLGGSLAVVGYGLVQMAGLDPVSWSGRFGDAVIAQFGNPDFVAGYLGIVVPLALWGAVASTWERPVRYLAAAITVGAAVVIVGAGAVQGYVTAVAGIVVVAFGWLALRVREPAPILAGLVALLVGGGAVVLAGSAGLGPATGLWELSTVRSRGYLWATALEMVGAEPLAGIGLDLFGRYYHEFRPLGEAVRRDLDQAADAAHNVPLHLAAGGGLPVALAWFGLVVVTAWGLVRWWRRGERDQRRLVVAFGAAYLCYHLQALVSIDVPPLAATHFVLVGAIAGASGMVELRRAGRASRVGSPSRRRWVTAGLGLPMVVILGIVLLADRAAGRAERAAAAGDLAGARVQAAEATDYAPWQPAYHFERARVLAEDSDLEAALAAMGDVIDRDPRDLAAWVSRARLLRALDRPLAAVEAYREALMLAPRSPQLTVEYAEVLAEVGQAGRARDELIELLRIVPGFAPAEELLAELDRDP